MRSYKNTPRLKVGLFSLLTLILSGLNLVQAQDDELLAPDAAFAFKAVLNDRVIDTSWSIADGYYMYADKLSFAVTGSDATLETFSWPKGKNKNDPLFGDVEIYEGTVAVQLPLSMVTDQITLKVRGQGCNEPIGVCYPPISHSIKLIAATASVADTLSHSARLELASSEEINSARFDFGSLDELRDLLGAEATQNEFLPVEQAFDLLITPEKDHQLLGNFYIADGYYLYQHKIKFSVAGVPVSKLQFPAGKIKQDDYFGEVTVHQKDFALPILLSNATSGALTIDAEYQGCAEQGICYPPVQKSFTLSMPSFIQSAVAAGDQGSVSTAVEPTKSLAYSKSIWLFLIGAFIAGVGLTFTPCVLPLIPILSSVIVGQGEQLSKSKALWLSVVYVLGTAVTYALMGAFAGATGDQLQAYFQNVWAIGSMAIVLVLMALAMFGLYQIQMPAFIQSRIQQKSQGLKGGSTPIVFVLGLLSALIVGVCVSPVLISFLGVAIAQGSPTLGAAIMFAMALGMGVPLVILALGAGHLLPQAGIWMDKVKSVFGVMLLALAIYLLEVLPQVPVLLLWAALFIVVAVYFGATQSLPAAATGWQKLLKGMGTLLLVWGVLALMGGLYGQRDILQPLPKNLLASWPATVVGQAQVDPHFFKPVNDEVELETKLAQAQAEGKYVVIDYYADWCVDCVRMEKTTFVDAAVQAKMRDRFMPLQVDLTDPNNADGKALKKRYGVFGPPAMLFIDPNGQQIKNKTFYGYKSPSEFINHISSL